MPPQLLAMLRMLMQGGQQPEVADDAATQRMYGAQNLESGFRDTQGRAGMNAASVSPTGRRMIPGRFPRREPTPTNMYQGDQWRVPGPGMPANLRAYRDFLGMMQKTPV
jgi:hypothetical protein